MATQTTTFPTEAEYLELERRAETKSEYHHGQMFAMAGGSPDHGGIIVNVASEVRQQLRGKGCRVFSSDVRLRANARRALHLPGRDGSLRRSSVRGRSTRHDCESGSARRSCS